MASKDSTPLGIGCDIGTMNIVSARRQSDGSVETSRVRDAFLDLDQSAKRARSEPSSAGRGGGKRPRGGGKAAWSGRAGGGEVAAVGG